MRVELQIAGPSVYDLVTFLQREYGWVFEEMSQDTTFRGRATGSHRTPEAFVNIGISDGTYIQGYIELDPPVL